MLGHCDAVDALVYLSRMAPWDYHTTPPPEYSRVNSWVPPELMMPQEQVADVLLKALGRQSRN